MSEWSLEADTQKELKTAIIQHKNTGWQLIREWEDAGTFCALMEDSIK